MKNTAQYAGRLIAALLLVMLAAGQCPAAQMFSPGNEKGWETKVKEGKAATYKPGDGEDCICLKSEKSSFSLQRKVDIDVKKTPYVSWRWKVLKLPEGGDLRKSRRDDQAAQLFVAFDGKKSISYVWDTTAPVGATGEHWVPWVMTVKVVVVASGPSGLEEWVTVTRNVYEDYKRLYKEEPPKVQGLRFQINSQHTATTAESCIDTIEFRETP